MTERSTIITFEDIAEVRPIAQNIQDLQRIQPYIVEAEKLDVLPAIGVRMYRQMIEARKKFLANNKGVLITTNSGSVIQVRKNEFTEILNGGYYIDCCNREEVYQGGLISAISYLTYARAIMQNSINFTAFGVVVKKTDTSEPASDTAIIRASNQAKKTGLAILGQVIEYLRCKKLLPCTTRNLRHKRKFKVIGD